MLKTYVCIKEDRLKRRVRELEMQLAESRRGVSTQGQDVPHPWPRGPYTSNGTVEPSHAHNGSADDRVYGAVGDDDVTFTEKSVRFADEAAARRHGSSLHARSDAALSVPSDHPRARAYGETLHDWAHDEREGGDGTYVGHPLDVSHAPPEPASYRSPVGASRHRANDLPSASARAGVSSARPPPPPDTSAEGSHRAADTSVQHVRNTSAVSADHSMSPVTPGRPADELLMSDLDQTEDDWLQSKVAAAQYVVISGVI